MNDDDFEELKQIQYLKWEAKYYKIVAMVFAALFIIALII